MLRVLRMKQVVRRHMSSAVTEAAVKLGFTLLCILLIAAGLFYELQKYGVGPKAEHPSGSTSAKMAVCFVSTMCQYIVKFGVSNLCGLLSTSACWLPHYRHLR